jgi:hypothetical protein
MLNENSLYIDAVTIVRFTCVSLNALYGSIISKNCCATIVFVSIVWYIYNVKI